MCRDCQTGLSIGLKITCGVSAHEPGRRQEEAFRLLSVIQTQISPQAPISIHPMDVIATVVAVRRQQLGIG